MKLSNLASVLRNAGLTVVEMAGWANRGYAGQDLQAVAGVLWHHTATNRSRFNEDAPTLNMCLNGRSDLAGPLCNIVFGRTGTVYLLAAGVANHAGAGSAHGIPTNMGNHYLVGIEMESSGIAPWDWTADQIRVAPHLGAAIERAYGASLQIAHYEYSSQGKIDPAGWPGGMDGLRASINAILDGQTINLASTGITPQSTTVTPQEEDIMASIDDLANVLKRDDVLEEIARRVHTRPVPYFDPVTGKDTGTGTTLAVLAGASDFQHAATRRTLADAAGAIVDAVKAAQPEDAAGVAQAAYDEFIKKLDATTIKVVAQ